MGTQSHSENIHSNPVRVLLVEDSILDARFLAADFTKQGGSEFSLKTVRSLDEAVRAFAGEPADVIILDLFLEEIQGLETLAAMRKAAPEIPIVVLTALNDENLGLQALKHGAQDYLIKGNVDSRSLFRAIRYARERKQVENERRSLELRSLQMQKLEALGTLAGGVSHNFNNILMAITGHAHLLLETKPDDEVKRHLESIRRAATRASALTRQLLMFSHRETGELALVSLNRIVQDMEELIRSVLGQDIAVTFDFAAAPMWLRADATQIQHMIMSVVLNARDAIAGTGRIDIRTEWLTSESGPEAKLTIADNGCGIPSEIQGHIFEPFFTTKGLAIAAGLGLSTVYGIVEHHRGRIEVASNPGQGTLFTITLPGAMAAVSAA
jgi:two-component system cell cycle sensor histidine kinase/response regulator CckA